ncbi:tetratricopeptide repeat protein [Candidatus Poribacteria bacterium]|nr:tetratricopeptide repeat protein [Candidatus Poribacteria bacterium]
MDQGRRLTKEEVKSDQFVDSTLQVYEFLKTHLKSIIIGATIVILVVGGFAFYQHQQQTARAEAFLKYTEAIEKYQEAESDWFDADGTEKPFETAATQLQAIFQKYPETSVADKARYNYAKARYYEGDYDGAISHFQMVVNEHQPENQILALYAQKAIGNCHEQKGEYQKALEAYTPAEDKLPQIAMRDYAFSDFRLSQARCYEKLGDFDNALAIYKDIIDLFKTNLEKAIQQKSRDLIPGAKALIARLPQPPSVTAAEGLENEGNYHEAFAAYAKVIHDYKVDKDIHGGLTDERRRTINRFEKTANDFLINLRDARRAESEGQDPLNDYVQAVGLGGRSFYEKVFGFAPHRSLYEKALFHRDKLQHVQ